MQKNNYLFIIGLLTVSVTTLSVGVSSCAKNRDFTTVTYTDKIQLGKLIFNDKNLSSPAGQSCASCHSPNAAFSDLNHDVVTGGAVAGLFGNRNAPAIAYSMFTPAMYFDTNDSVYIGGLFLDGRVNTLEQQAQKPFMNPLEMNNPSIAALIEKIRRAGYYPIYKQLYGEATSDAAAFDNIAEAIAAFERTPDLNPFSSKYDYYLKGQAALTDQEMRGLALFNDENKGKCAQCHITDADEESGKVLFTDFTYDNIGVPKNLSNPFYHIPATYNPAGMGATDRGLGGFLNDAANDGKFRVPSLRNAAVTAPYFHNGFFNTLEEVVHFYNKRDVESFPAAEVVATVNHSELGDLGLSSQEEKDIVAFIKTLTDGYK